MYSQWWRRPSIIEVPPVLEEAISWEFVGYIPRLCSSTDDFRWRYIFFRRCFRTNALNLTNLLELPQESSWWWLSDPLKRFKIGFTSSWKFNYEASISGVNCKKSHFPLPALPHKKMSPTPLFRMLKVGKHLILTGQPSNKCAPLTNCIAFIRSQCELDPATYNNNNKLDDEKKQLPVSQSSRGEEVKDVYRVEDYLNNFRYWR